MRTLELPEPVKRIIFLVTVVLGTVLVIGMLINAFSGGGGSPNEGTAASSTPTTQTKKISPLLFGTNLDLSQNNPQLQATPGQRLLQNMHVQIVRISLAEKPDQQEITRQAQYIRGIGAVPLVSLHSPLYPQALADNTLAIQAIGKVFPEGTVYYEYGDEEDALGMTADQYTKSWNETVPKLKQLAPRAHFVGPATYRYDENYLQSFLEQARPLPNEVSWHEFPCASTWTQQQCLTGITTWNQHITSARKLMSKVAPTSLPVMITAWNYAANAATTDGKSTDKTFMTNWTENALQTLATNNVFASMQYSGVNTPAPLISQNNALTAQGQTFRTFYEKFMTQPVSTQSSSPTTTSSPASTPTATDTGSETDTPVETPTTDTGVTAGNPPTDPGVPVDPTPTTSTLLPGDPAPGQTPTSPTDGTNPVPTPTVSTAPEPTPPPAQQPTPTKPKPTATPKPKPTATPTPKPTMNKYAVDGKNPTTYKVDGKTCSATQSNSTPKSVDFNGVKATLYFQFSKTCHAAWAKVVFSKPIASKALGSAKVSRTGGPSYDCNSGGNNEITPGQTSCYTGMVYDGPDATASAYAWYRNTSGSSSWSARLGPY